MLDFLNFVASLRKENDVVVRDGMVCAKMKEGIKSDA